MLQTTKNKQIKNLKKKKNIKETKINSNNHKHTSASKRAKRTPEALQATRQLNFVIETCEAALVGATPAIALRLRWKVHRCA